MRPAGSMLAAASLAWIASASLAAAPFDFYSRGPYRAGMPRPADVLGYELGTYHTSYGNMERYVAALAGAGSDRARRIPYGRTYEFRERALLAISSAENLARLDAIRQATQRLADPRATSAAEAAQIAKTLPVTVWLNFTIHGDESASFEAMLQVAYQLAAGEDSATRAIRGGCVVLLNLGHNPDGHERFVTWVNAKGTGDPDPWALEQQGQQPWGIGGRSNHYQFDMNRDALAMSQVESRQQAAAMRAWRPQVVVDLHGQTTQYFFPPVAEPVNLVFPRESLMRWLDTFGRGNAAAFDRFGWHYYVRHIFDFFYPGYWDIWPTLWGAVGMTYETDGGGNLALRRDDETVVTLRDGIVRHFTAALATCETAARTREQRLRDFHAFLAEAVGEGRRGETRAFVLVPGADARRAAQLVEGLLHAGVEVQLVPRPFRSGAAQPVFWDAPEEKAPKDKAKPAEKPAALARPLPPAPPVGARAFPAGCYLVDLAQPGGRVARAFLEREARMDTGFVRTQLEKFERNRKRGKKVAKEPYDFYDVTAWSLPLTYGVEAYALRDAGPAGGVPLAVPEAPTDPAEADAERLPDSLAVGVPMPARFARGGPAALRAQDGAVAVSLEGGVQGGRAGTAYVWAYDSDGAARMALRLLQEDFKVAVAQRALRAAGRDFPRGSFVARVERNPDRLHDRVAALARTCGVQVQAVNTAYTDRGDTGVGSESVVSLKRPKIAVVADRPVSTTSFGWTWFLLERVMGARFTALPLSAIAGGDLSRYNVIVFPDGDPGGYAGELGEGGVGRLKDWIQRGGTLVTLSDASEFPTLEKVGLSSSKLVGEKRKEGEKESGASVYSAPAGAAGADTAKAREEEKRPEPVPGAILRAGLDLHHYLTYGYGSATLPVPVESRRFYKKSKDGANVAVFEKRPLLVSGFVWPDTEDQLHGTAWLLDEPHGEGHVVMFAGDPNYRMFWRATTRLFLNAVMLGPALD